MTYILSLTLNPNQAFQQEGVFVFHCDRVKGSVVMDKLEGSVLLFDEEHWRRHGGFGQLNASGLQVLLEESIQLFLL